MIIILMGVYVRDKMKAYVHHDYTLSVKVEASTIGRLILELLGDQCSDKMDVLVNNVSLFSFDFDSDVNTLPKPLHVNMKLNHDNGEARCKLIDYCTKNGLRIPYRERWVLLDGQWARSHRDINDCHTPYRCIDHTDSEYPNPLHPASWMSSYWIIVDGVYTLGQGYPEAPYFESLEGIEVCNTVKRMMELGMKLPELPEKDYLSEVRWTSRYEGDHPVVWITWQKNAAPVTLNDEDYKLVSDIITRHNQICDRNEAIDCEMFFNCRVTIDPASFVSYGRRLPKL